MKALRSGVSLAIVVISVAGCASQRPPTPKGEPSEAASRIVGTHPLTCFPSDVTASLGGESAAQQASSPPVASAARPVEATIQLATEPANVALKTVSLQVFPVQRGVGMGSSTIVPATRPSRPSAVKTIVVPSPVVGVTYRLRVDDTGDKPGVTLPSGVYDVDVVQEVAVGPSCVSSETSGPDEEFEVDTTIGQVRLP
jgi:hypothetical protein